MNKWNKVFRCRIFLMIMMQLRLETSGSENKFNLTVNRLPINSVEHLRVTIFCVY